MSLDAQSIKSLRERTGVGILDCKNALMATEGDLEKAIDWLRQKGLAKAAKKQGRTAAEGLVSLKKSFEKATLIEVNAETDFVARSADFQSCAQELGEIAHQTGKDSQSILDHVWERWGRTVREELQYRISVMGENIVLRRCVSLQRPATGVLASYIHGSIAPGMGRIGVIVALEGATETSAEDLAHQLALHISAMSPEAVSVDDLSEAMVSHEKSLIEVQVREEAAGKPDHVIEKMIEGRLRKFCKDLALLEQPFVKDTQKTVGTILEEFGKQQGSPVRVVQFVRFQLGEGIEVEHKNFAEEVASQLRS